MIKKIEQLVKEGLTVTFKPNVGGNAEIAVLLSNGVTLSGACYTPEEGVDSTDCAIAILNNSVDALASEDS